MLASKENARKALRAMAYLSPQQSPEFSTVKRFIESALRRLPREESYKRDRERRRGKATT
jgi:hypothetical protein